MRVPIGPSLQIVLFLADQAGSVAEAALQAIWARWFDPRRFDRQLVRFEKRGLIEVHRGDVERVVLATKAGRTAALGGRDPEACWSRPWDGKWRIIVFDIPESEEALRTKLRRQLRELGFGFLQQSVWINPDSPGSLQAALRQGTIDTECLTFFEATLAGGESDAHIVAGAWDFARINRGYQLYMEMLDAFPWHQGAVARQAWLAAEWKAWCLAIRMDPLLPNALLPDGYLGKVALNRRRAFLRQILGAGSP